jgi:hypothetical protein
MFVRTVGQVREYAVTYALESVLCKSSCAFNAPEPEKRRLNFPFNILVRELPSSSSSGRGRFALDGGFDSVDGPGFHAEAGRGELFVGSRVSG